MSLGDFLKTAGGLVAPFNPLIAGGATLLGGIMSNRASAKQAENQMDFQAHQSATAHQREVADLRAAGLNPILSGTGGMGASSGSGAMAPQMNVLGPAVSSAMDTARGASEIQERTQKYNINRPEELIKIAAANAITAASQPTQQLIDKLPEIIGAATSTAYRAVEDVKGHALPFLESMSHPHLKPGSAALDFIKEKLTPESTYYTKSNPAPASREGWDANDMIRSWFRRFGGNSAKSHQHSGPVFNDTGQSKNTQEFLKRYRLSNP